MKTEEVAADVLRILAQNGKTLATAESCTGGLVGKLLTDIPGSSAVYMGGVISYTNGVKQRLLGVSEETLRAYTAVSRQTATEMAKGAREAVCADVGVSVTGLAGPGGGTPEQPVGTVYVGFAFGSTEWVSGLRLWEWDAINRNSIRRHTALCAFGIAEHILAEVGNQ